MTHASPRAVIATPAEGSAAGAASARLSQTGRLISFLLTGQPPAPPAKLAGGQPLVPVPPTSGGQLAVALRQAIGESGLFYESQLARWLSGTVATDALLRQPQSQLTRGRDGVPPGTPGGGSGDGAPATSAQTATRAGPSSTPATLNTTAAAAFGADAEEISAASQSAAAQRSPGAAAGNPVPERLMPLVHQQLDALATNNYAWQGAAWPGQHVEIEIEEPEQREGDGADPEDAAWKTTLRVTLPRLGGVEARLHLTPAGVALQLTADDAGTAAALTAAERELAVALAAADLPLTEMRVDLAAAPDDTP